MASSQPNMTNLPSGKTYGKAIKENFEAPKGKLMIGADFQSLEDMVAALITKDPNKLRVYEEGYDSHALRAYYYFKEQMPDIRQATNTERCFKITLKNHTAYYKSGDFIVDSNGTYIPIEDYYDSHN
jgi:DNA polymerase-1